MHTVGGRCLVVLMALVVATAVPAGARSAGAQVPICFGEAATIVADSGAVTWGTDSDDVIVGTVGADDIRAGDGNDLVCGLAGADVIRGNAGDDHIDGGSGSDRIFGGKGPDLIIGGRGHDELEGNSGRDTIQGKRGEDRIWGGLGDDVIFGGPHDDTIYGNQNNDTISGGSDHDTISGGKANDVLRGKSGHDTVLGMTGADDIDGGKGFDVCRGGAGDDDKASCETTEPVGAVDWSDPTLSVDLGEGWTVAACEGDAPFLCMTRDGLHVGVVEGTLRWALSSFRSYDPDASDAANLRTFAAESFDGIRDDRAGGCGPGYTLELTGPDRFAFGGRRGLSYGLKGTNADSTPSEYHLMYTTISGDELVLIGANAYDNPGCPGRDDQSSWTTETLTQARPIIEVILRASPLPPT